MQKLINPIARFALVFTLVGAGCGELFSDPLATPAVAVDEVSDRSDFEGHYHEIFIGSDARTIYVVGRSEHELRLYRTTVEPILRWHAVELPEALRDVVRAQITSLHSDAEGLIIATRERGAWQLDASTGTWRRFAPDLGPEHGQITRVTSREGRRFAHVVYTPETEPGRSAQRRVQVWSQLATSQETGAWQLEHEAVHMLIDYLPQRTKAVRSTMYGTVEVAHAPARSWEQVREISGSPNPRLIAWGEGIGVVSRAEVWRSDANAEHWEKVSDEGAWSFARAGDALVLSDLDRRLYLLMADGTRHPLPSLPSENQRPAEVAASGDAIFATAYDDSVYRLASDHSAWVKLTPGVDQNDERDFR